MTLEKFKLELGELNEADLKSFIKPQKRNVHFIFIFLNCDGFDSTSELFNNAYEIFENNDICVLDILSGITLAAVNIPNEKTDSEVIRSETVKELSKKLSKNIKIIHGSEDHFVGNYGSNNRQNYGIYFQNIIELITQFKEMNFGEVLQYKPECY